MTEINEDWAIRLVCVYPVVSQTPLSILIIYIRGQQSFAFGNLVRNSVHGILWILAPPADSRPIRGNDIYISKVWDLQCRCSRFLDPKVTVVRKPIPYRFGTTELGYGTTNADAGMGIGMLKGK